MANVCLYFQVHQPWRLPKYSVTEIGMGNLRFEEEHNEKVLKKVATKSYIPMLSLITKISEVHKGFSASFSLTGVVLEQFAKYCPEVIVRIQELVKKRNFEVLGETYYHSLASLYSPIEFLYQVQKHGNLIHELFGRKPRVFRNTELIYTNDIAQMVMHMGYRGMVAEGADKILRGRKPTLVYKAPCGIPLLLKHYQLSDDIAFRFSASSRSDKPLTAETFAHWINSNYGDEETVNLFMDFETFGEHQWEDTGIFNFFEKFVAEFIDKGGNFLTVSSALQGRPASDIFDSDAPVSWADVDRDITAWRGNKLQEDSLQKIYGLEEEILASGDENLIEDWRKLQTSDHFYYMCTKWANDGDVHAYFSPYKTPYLAYANFNNALTDIKIRLRRKNV